MRSSLLLPFLMLTASTAFAQSFQPDYVVTTKGDTLRGRIRKVGKHNGQVRLYRPGQAPTVFGPDEASSFGSVGGPEGVSRMADKQGRRQFLVPLVQGHVSLFVGENEKQDKRYYLQVPDSAYVIEVARATNQLTLARNLAGCPALSFGSNELQRRYPYNTPGLSKLVMAYNQCRQPQQPTAVVKRGSGTSVAAGVKAGLNVSAFELSNARLPGTRSGSSGFQGGVTINLANRSPLSLQFEAMYMTLRSTYGPFEASLGNSGIPSNTNLVTIHYNQIQLPALLRYTAGFGVLRPYFNAGLLYGINTGNTSTLSFPIASNAPVRIPVSEDVFGFTVGGGLMVRRAGLPALTLEARYDKIEGTEPLGKYVKKQNSLRFDLGVSF